MDTVTGKPTHKELPSKRKRAKRLDPALRQELILDSATRLVQTRDTANFTLDEVAIEAGVSRPLIHRYFPCRDSLLLALLEREFDLILGVQAGLVPDDFPTSEAHKIYINRHFKYLKDRGRIFHLLLGESQAEGGKAAQTAMEFSKRNTRYWINRKVEDGLSEAHARLGMLMTLAALQGAEGTLRLEKLSVDETSDFWTTFVLAGWEAVAKKFSAPTDSD